MARPISSALSHPDVLCTDGTKRTFRQHNPHSLRGFVRIDGVSVTGTLRQTAYADYFDADPSGKWYAMLSNDSATANIKRLVTELSNYMIGNGITPLADVDTISKQVCSIMGIPYEG